MAIITVTKRARVLDKDRNWHVEQSDATTKVRCLVWLRDEFEVAVGVRTPRVSAEPIAFQPRDGAHSKYSSPHINIQKKTPKDLLYADDVVLIRDNHAALEGSLERWSTALESTGLKISRNKTEHMQCCYSAANQP